MEILDKKLYDEYENFCSNHEKGAFQQSINWAKVKKEWLHEVVVSRDNNGNIVGGVSILIKKIGPFGMMYAPRGPVCDYTDKAVMTDLVSGIKAVAKKHHGYKFICDPLVLASDKDTIAFFRECGFSINENAPFHDTIQPRYNYMLNYIKGLTEDELLMKFNTRTRYYIRFSAKNNVVCKEGIEHLDDFYKIYQETGVRKKFSIRSKEYLRNFLESFPNNAKLFVCYFEDKPLCGGLSVQYAGTTSHVYGCSTDEMRKIHPTDHLQWQMMKWALSGNCHTYDMQGISPDEETDEELYKVYLFKSKFLGDIIETAGEFTITFNSFADKFISYALKVRSKMRE